MANHCYFFLKIFNSVAMSTKENLQQLGFEYKQENIFRDIHTFLVSNGWVMVPE